MMFASASASTICASTAKSAKVRESAGSSCRTRAVSGPSSEDPVYWLRYVTGTEPALGYAIRSMEAGKHFVTANKQLVSRHGEQLFEVAGRAGVPRLGPIGGLRGSGAKAREHARSLLEPERARGRMPTGHRCPFKCTS